LNSLPLYDFLPINILSRCFNDVTNSYKFYWFLSILEHFIETGEHAIHINDIAFRMISSAWYPLDFFKLSFGKQDGLKIISLYLSSKIVFDHSPNSSSLNEQIISNLSKEEIRILYSKINKLIRYVPFRFLRPFFSNELRGLQDQIVDIKIKDLSNKNILEKKLPYSFENKKIILNPIWLEYLSSNQIILKGFVKWKLLHFIQKNNPNIFGITEKLDKPIARNMKIAIKYWRSYLNQNDIRCIFSNQILNKFNISIDHFLPWSYLAHDLNWNLAPTTKEINSSKGNNIPSFNDYFEKFAIMQYDSFKFNYKVLSENILSEYSLLFCDKLENIYNYSFQIFYDKMSKFYLPQIQIAQNMGFNYGWKY